MIHLRSRSTLMFGLCFLSLFAVFKTVEFIHDGKAAQQGPPQKKQAAKSWDSINVKTNKREISIEARQSQMKKRLADYCRSNHPKLGLPNLYRFQVIESPKLIYCMVPKVASRQWRTLLHNVRLQKKQLRSSLDQYKSVNVCNYLTKSFRFMFVREPFERLLSAYKDKFVLTRGVDRYMLNTYGRNIIKKFRPNATRRALKTGDDVSFPEFIEYLIKDGVREGLNWHWNTYEDQCRPCSVEYDYIGRFETLAQDADFVLNKAGVFNLTKFPRVHHSKTKSELLQYYAHIPLDWIMQLGQIYRSSFEMFGYPFPGPLESLFRNVTIAPAWN